MKKNLPLIAIVAIIVVGALAFFGGMKFGEAKAPAGNQFANPAFNGRLTAQSVQIRPAGSPLGGIGGGQTPTPQNY